MNEVLQEMGLNSIDAKTSKGELVTMAITAKVDDPDGFERVFRAIKEGVNVA